MNRFLGEISSQFHPVKWQKHSLPRALLKKPRLLILDEPYDGLDHRSRRSLKTMLERLIDDHIQVVLITHRFEEIMSNISHVLLLKNGSVYRHGRRNEILTKEILAGLYRSENRLPAGSDRFSVFSSTRSQKQSGYLAENGKTAENILIKMTDTTVKFKDVTVLDKVNWTVKQGDNWMILGPNGAGKTTLLKLILGENQQAYANDISLFGRKKGSGETVWDIKKNIGFISSELQIRHPGHLSAFNIVCSGFFDSIGLYRLCSAEQKNMARAWMDTLGIASLAKKKFGQLSHGQCQLVLIARAMVKSPVLLILDEPCDGLDIANRDNLLNLLGFIGKHTDTSLIYVTHHEAEMIACITHVLSLDRGKIVNITRGPGSDQRRIVINRTNPAKFY